MGGSGEHLYCFEFPCLGISIEDDFEEQEIFSVKETTIDRFLTLEKEFEYIYDFGDNWEHSIIVEKYYNTKGETRPKIVVELGVIVLLSHMIWKKLMKN